MVEALVTTLTLTKEAFSWKPFVVEKGRVSSSPFRSYRGNRIPTLHLSSKVAAL
jgi:hypothetical protein